VSIIRRPSARGSGLTLAHAADSGGDARARDAGGRFACDGAATAVRENVRRGGCFDARRFYHTRNDQHRLRRSWSNQSGAIALQCIGGATTISTGSGAVVVEGTKGPPTVTTSSSAFTARAPGDHLHVRTGSGAVDAGFEGAGDVYIETGSSAIQLRGVRGALTAATRSGHVAIEGNPDRQWAVSTGSSGIDVDVASPPRVLDVASGSGSVRVAGATVNGSVSTRAVNGTIGSGGPTVRISTRSGSVRINVGR
jgi:Putative adhesin